MRIFEEPPEELDESWTHGVLVGGMASATDSIEIACAYRTAADSLIAPALKSGEAWRFTYPILFLYRHALELHLKAILQPSKRTHELRPLIREFEKLVKTRFGENLPT